MSPKNKNICNMCTDAQLHFTQYGSPNKAEVMLGGNYLYINGDDGVQYTVKCNFCPMCGRKLEKK